MIRRISTHDAFGKFHGEDDWHPLDHHMADVSATFLALCECVAIRRTLESAAERALDEIDVARLAAIVFLHDLGKANAGFQAKRWQDNARPKHRQTAGHGIEAIALIDAAYAGEPEASALLSQAPILAIFEWGTPEAIDNLLRASISHHGRPLANPPDWFDARVHWNAHPDYQASQQLGHVSDALRRFLPQAFGSSGRQLPGSQRFVHAFAGLVQLADWLGSDTRFFPFSNPGEDRLARSRALAKTAVRDIGLDADPYRQALARRHLGFSDVFDAREPYPAQAAMADDTLGPVVVLEAETGSGKTEAALWRFFHLFAQGKVDGLYFALPTRVAATQAYARIGQAVARTWPSGDAPIVVRALSGYAAADSAVPRSLPDFKVLWSDDPTDAEAARRWAAESAKRFLAAPIAVGTVDQALLGTLQVKHAHLRHALAARTLLVVDEVHASDAYMGVLIEQLINAQTALGGHTLLLSATLGVAARARYLSAGQPARRNFPPLAQACALPYPAISDSYGLRPTSGAQREKHVAWRCDDCIDDPERIAALAIDAAAQGARVLVIRNTVPAAIATLAALEAACPDVAWLFRHNGVATLHHSRFSREDRPALDAAVESALGKKRPSGPLILVGTQTLEQSLDLDADYLITDLCPMDVLLQRIGRLHRHERPADARPAAFRAPRVAVLTPAGGDLAPFMTRPRHGLGRFRDGGGVYADVRILEATRRLVEAEALVRIPSDNRRLVESATHPEALHAIEAVGEAWAAHAQDIEGDTGARRTSAKLGLLPLDTAFSELAFPSDVKLATRLGAADRVVEFSPSLPGPFGSTVCELPIRHHLLPHGLALDAQPDEICTEAGGFRFRLGDSHYRYSRFGLERLPKPTT